MKYNLKMAAVVLALFTGLMTKSGTAAPSNTAIGLSVELGKDDNWKDPGWKDPGKIMPQIGYDGLPLSEVIKDICDQFTNAFDVLTPSEWKDPQDTKRFSGDPLNPQGTIIKMTLRKVTASEVFNAMNLMFEAENSPLRWKLVMNGNRPTALLRLLPEFLPHPPPPDRPKRMVFFVGQLLGDPSAGGMTMEQLIDTIQDIYKMSLGEPKGLIKFHKEAQLLIVTGGEEQIELIQQIIMALQQKAASLPGPR
jgi:hypothetical protein